MEVGLYININGVVKRLDTFDDEKIKITSSIQNVNDISKTFTDFSQTFSVPASKNNNEIFGHWYENSNDNGFNQNIRYNGYIEIDSQVFRVGKWQIESAQIKDGQVNNYKLTFYGLLVSLKDLFGEDKINTLTDINQYNFEFTSGAVSNRLRNTTSAGNIIYPLITSERVWDYNFINGSIAANNIDTSTGAIDKSELFPAVPVFRLFEAIENKYGITFNGNFLNDPRFKQLYLWYKNSEKFEQLSSITPINITSNPSPPAASRFLISLANNTIQYLGKPPSTTNNPFNKITVNISGLTSSSTSWTIFVYRNNLPYSQIQGTGNTNDVEILDHRGNVNTNSQFEGFYKFDIQTSVPTSNVLFQFDCVSNIAGTLNTNQGFGSASTTGDINLSTLAPDIKVSDFFIGILKMFNLTCYSNDEVTYEIEQLEKWYANGKIKDITKYVTTDLTYERYNTYKQISFNYQKSESFVNRQYVDNNALSTEYGDLDYTISESGGEYKIELPFEKLKYFRIADDRSLPSPPFDSNLQVAYSLTNPPDYKPYLPKPVLFYAFGNVPCPTFRFKVDGAGAPSSLTDYCLTGDFIDFANTPHTINWGLEQIFGIVGFGLSQLAPNGLFFNYYLLYLQNLYNLKSRIVKCKAVFSLPFLNSLELNDRLIIRDKRYTINQMQTDLTTGEVSLDLIQDFREVKPVTIVSLPPLTKEGGITLIPFDNVLEDFVVITDTGSLVRSLTIVNGLIELELDSNTSGVDQTIEIQGDDGSLITIFVKG